MRLILDTADISPEVFGKEEKVRVGDRGVLPGTNLLSIQLPIKS